MGEKDALSQRVVLRLFGVPLVLDQEFKVTEDDVAWAENDALSQRVVLRLFGVLFCFFCRSLLLLQLFCLFLLLRY